MQFDLLTEKILSFFLLEAEKRIIREISDKAQKAKNERTIALKEKNKKLAILKTQELVVLRDYLKSELEKPTLSRPQKITLSDKDVDEYIIDPSTDKYKVNVTQTYPGLYFLHSDNLKHFKASITS